MVVKYRVLGALFAVFTLSALLPGLAVGQTGARVYEMVSPVYKGGFGSSHIEAVADNGNSVAFYSPGAFAGAPSGLQSIGVIPYMARRGEAGWSTSPIMPPDTLMPYAPYGDVTPTLEIKMASGQPGANLEDAIHESTQWDTWLHETSLSDSSAYWQLVYQPLETITGKIRLLYQGASNNFCDIFFQGRGDSGPLMEKAKGTSLPLYDLSRGCAGTFVGLSLVGVDNKGNNLSPACSVSLGDEYGAPSANSFNAVAMNGVGIFFTVCVHNNPTRHQLFLRLEKSHTIEISKPSTEKCFEVPCKGAERASADFVGAAEDGSRVFFTTTAPLTNEGDESKNLYMAEIGCPEIEPECPVGGRAVTRLVRVSAPVAGPEAAGLLGVVRVAPDGGHVYFVATGYLLGAAESAALESEGKPIPKAGADNLYAYDVARGHLSFIGDLCSGYEISGIIETVKCPNSNLAATDERLVAGGISEAQTGGRDGKFLVFSTFAQLTRDDTDTAKDVYRYDAETETLTRLSVGEDGHDFNGNDNAADATISFGHHGGSVRAQYELDTRAISEDGTRAVFVTSEPLSPHAVNGLPNAYEWHEGEVKLVSTGSAETAVEDVVMAPEGKDVFFSTTQGLVEEDTDNAPDIYDARIGGGFPSKPAERQPCLGDACQGPLTNPAPVLVPGSASQAPGSNFAAPKASLSEKKLRSKAKMKRKRRHRRHATTSSQTARRRKG